MRIKTAEYREKNRLWQKAYRQRYPEKHRARVNAWRANNLEKARSMERERYHKSPERYREKSRWTIIKCNYGITKQQYLDMFEKQDGKCAICRRPPEEGRYSTSRKWLNIDHDHRCCPSVKSCGKCIRGLLCGLCNIVIGRCDDDPDLMMGCAEYVKRHRAEMNADVQVISRT